MGKVFLGTHEVTSYKSYDNDGIRKAVNGTTLVRDLYQPPMDFSDVRTIEKGVLQCAYRDNLSITDLSSLKNVSTIKEYGCRSAFENCTNLTTIDLSSLTSITYTYSCYCMFKGCTSITSIDLSNLTTIYGSNSSTSMFENCTGITGELDLSSLTKIGLDYRGNVCSRMFQGCTGITSVNMHNCTAIDGDSCAVSMFEGCISLRTVDMHNVTMFWSPANSRACKDMFKGCTSLESIDLSSLTAIGGSTSEGMFAGTPYLTTLYFPSLRDFTSYGGFYRVFDSSSGIQNIYFYVLNSQSFMSNNSTFANFLTYTSGVTLHFPSNLQTRISQLTGYPNFGGSNTVLLFDLLVSYVLSCANGAVYKRSPMHDTSSSYCWYRYTNDDTPGFTTSIDNLQVGDTIYSDSACTTALTTITAIS